MRRMVLASIAGTLLATAAACGGPIMSWRGQPASLAQTGKVTVAVTDRRVGPQGGDDPSVIGSERGALMIPSAIRLSEPTEAADKLRELVTQAALTAGIGVVDAGGKARIAVDVQNMWCEGIFAAYTKARLGGLLNVLGPDGTPRTAAMPIQVEGAAGDCKSAYQQMLTNAYSQVAALLSQPAVKAAVGP
jgi:hypothetical protein